MQTDWWGKAERKCSLFAYQDCKEMSLEGQDRETGQEG